MRQPPFRLLGAERSYFTAKARPALRMKGVHFEEVLPTAEVYREIRKRTGLLFIPVVVTPEDETWQDTSDILDALEARFPEPALLPSTPVQRIAAYLLELYADEFMILPAMHYRWTAPESEADARGAFAALTGNPEAANVFADRMSGSLPGLGVMKKTIPAIVDHFDELLGHLETAFADQPFLLGAQPSLADCALMGPFYAHLYLDLVPGGIIRSRAPRVAHWIERTNHPNREAFAGFEAGDALHPSLRAMLQLIGRDAVPLLLDAVGAFETWADAKPSELLEPPRVVGSHTTRLRGIEVERFTGAYTLWMVQRSLDAYAALSAAERKAVDEDLAGTGCEELLAYEPRHRLGKKNFKLIFEEN